MMKHRTLSAAIAATALSAAALHAAPEIPLELPRYDGRAGDSSKPVQVYILAGQSNMVGFGHIDNSRPLHPSVFLSADPAVIPGEMPIGGSALAAHRIYQSADADAEPGAKVALHEGAYDHEADYARLTPAESATVALGTFSEDLPALDGPHTAIVTAYIEVPETGTYTLHPGFRDSTHAIATLGGREVYRREPGGRPIITKTKLEAGERHPLTITYLKTGSAALWMEQVDLKGTGDLMSYINQGKHTHLIEPDGEWVVRDDVIYKEALLRPDSPAAPLSVRAHGSMFGPELGFGFVMGTFHDEPVLLIKTAQGNRALRYEFRPPSSGRTNPDSEWEGREYRNMIRSVRETLEKIDELVPGYDGQGYEIAGFAWWQGHKDAGSTKEEYEEHLANLINDVRDEFDAPDMRAVVATVGFEGYRMNEDYQKIWAAQMAVGDPARHPSFEGNVASVDTRDFWRDVHEAPQPQGHHYHRSAATYLLTGEAMGRAMVNLLGGNAEMIPKTDREERVAAEIAAEAAKPDPTEAELAASQAAIKPIILDGALANFTADSRNWSSIENSIAGERPERGDASLLDDHLDTAADYFRKAGISDYDWQPFGGDIRSAGWHYQPIDVADPSSGVEDLADLPPAGMEDWFKPSFDPESAGWKTGPAPFGGNRKNPGAPDRPDWYQAPPRPEAATAFDNDGVLLRQTFDLPALKDGHRYRIRVAGSARANSGDGYAIFVNGRLLADVKRGIAAWRREGWRPRGSHIWHDFRDEFKGGETALAIAAFPMDNWSEGRLIPDRDPLSVWIEEMKIPSLDGPPETVESALGHVAGAQPSPSREEGARDTLIYLHGDEGGSAPVRIPHASPVSFSPAGDVLLLREAAPDDAIEHFLVHTKDLADVPPFGARKRIGGRWVTDHQWSDDGATLTLTSEINDSEVVVNIEEYFGSP